MSRVIALFNQCGGVGKSTLTMNLGYHLQERSHRVLLINMDPQASLTIFMGLEQELLNSIVSDVLADEDADEELSELPIHKGLHGLDLIPSSIDLSEIKSMVKKNGRTEFSASTTMKNPFHYIQEYPKRSKGLLGISYEQFLQLVRQAEVQEQQQQNQRERTKIRLNAKGGGRPPKLTIAEQVCLCLFYLRHLPTFEVLGIQFWVSKTEANDTFHNWLAVLRELLPASLLEQ